MGLVCYKGLRCLVQSLNPPYGCLQLQLWPDGHVQLGMSCVVSTHFWVLLRMTVSGLNAPRSAQPSTLSSCTLFHRYSMLCSAASHQMYAAFYCMHAVEPRLVCCNRRALRTTSVTTWMLWWCCWGTHHRAAAGKSRYGCGWWGASLSGSGTGPTRSFSLMPCCSFM